ncbi:uncharacterized protein LOC110110795 isoform X1 [Dendrobium catenatum]|uniref:DHHA1 domain-containing protein n=1 Tax=Dendrobium catenatum TaxID=906689 RepID=A0A2I0VCJ1_9ASPA|nr:uncharacterized protein LOC110110795 isoform X1 [Dendrobium catenatum]PKU61129.1 hypothetical protein MA16_Dca025292 [Dendrobium catenatum]
MNSLKKAAVLYHYPCPDGAFAALAAHLYFSAASLPVAFFPNPVYDPIRVESLPLDELSDIYLLDFIGASGFVAEVSSKVDSVTILDHHKTALDTISGNVFALRNVFNVIDVDRSGATIAYDYFNEKLIRRGISLGNHGGVCNGKFLPENKVEKVQRLFKFIEDGDLWRWELPHSKAFSSGLADMKIEYNVNVNSSLFDLLMGLDPELVISHGKETLAHKQKLIDSALDQSYEIALGCGLFGHCLAVDADFISELRSELGHQLANKSRNLNLRSIGAVVYKVPELKNDQLLKISLRSIELEDTTAISKEYGGGGHRKASSFILSAHEFSKWKV